MVVLVSIMPRVKVLDNGSPRRKEEWVLKTFQCATGVFFRQCKWTNFGWIFVLPSVEDVLQVMQPLVRAKLCSFGLQVVKTAQYRADCTLICYSMFGTLDSSSIKDMAAEIVACNNGVNVSSVKWRCPTSIWVEFNSPEEADKILNSPGGIQLAFGKRFSQLRRKEYRKVPQCSRCFSFQHTVKGCTRIQRFCYICGRKKHLSSRCQNRHAPHCINCSGEHIALSFQCPVRLQRERELEEVEVSEAESSDSALEELESSDGEKSEDADLEGNHFNGLRCVWPCIDNGQHREGAGTPQETLRPNRPLSFVKVLETRSPTRPAAPTESPNQPNVSNGLDFLEKSQSLADVPEGSSGRASVLERTPLPLPWSSTQAHSRERTSPLSADSGSKLTSMKVNSSPDSSETIQLTWSPCRADISVGSTSESDLLLDSPCWALDPVIGTPYKHTDLYLGSSNHASDSEVLSPSETLDLASKSPFRTFDPTPGSFCKKFDPVPGISSQNFSRTPGSARRCNSTSDASQRLPLNPIAAVAKQICSPASVGRALNIFPASSTFSNSLLSLAQRTFPWLATANLEASGYLTETHQGLPEGFIRQINPFWSFADFFPEFTRDIGEVLEVLEMLQECEHYSSATTSARHKCGGSP